MHAWCPAGQPPRRLDLHWPVGCQPEGDNYIHLLGSDGDGNVLLTCMEEDSGPESGCEYAQDISQKENAHGYHVVTFVRTDVWYLLGPRRAYHQPCDHARSLAGW